LVHLSIFLFAVSSDDVVPSVSFFVALVVIRCAQIELIIYDTLLPLTVFR
jgi:hypothetical protein